MSASNFTCPICNVSIEGTHTSCPRCGFKLIGTTQQFDPIADAPEDIHFDDEASIPELEVLMGPYTGESFRLGEGTFTIGRDPKCDIFLNNMTVSRHNSTIIIDGNSAKIIDAGSTNGTWVDGQIVDEAELKPGTHVQIGTFDMVFKRVK